METSAVGDELAAHCLQVPLATNFSVRDVDKKLLRELGVEVSKAFLRRHLLIVLVAVCLRPLPHNPLLSRVEGLELAFLKEEMAMLLLCQRKQKKKVEERRRKKGPHSVMMEPASVDHRGTTSVPRGDRGRGG